MDPSPTPLTIGLTTTPAKRVTEEVRPKRVLGLRDLVMFYVVTTLSLRWIPVAATVGPSSIVIWVVGLVTIFIPLALCIMELSSRYPQEGGMYVWSKRAFGDFPAFLTGWIYWTSNLPYFPAVLYFAASNALYIGGTRWAALERRPLFFITFSLLGVGLALVLNIVGLNIGKWLNNLGSLGSWLPVALLCVVGVVAWAKFGSATGFAPSELKPSLNFGMFGVWATLLYAFAGAEAGSFMGDEIKNARRVVPPALIVAGVIVTAGYILGTIAILVALPRSQVNNMEGIMQAISTAAARIGWTGVGSAVALLICLASLSLHRVRAFGTSGQQRARRLSASGDNEHHNQLHPLSVYVCGVDSPAAGAGRVGSKYHSRGQARRDHPRRRGDDHYLRSDHRLCHP